MPFWRRERVYTAMEWWTKIRLEVLRGETSKRAILRRENIHWETLKKILQYPEPPGYRSKKPRPKPKLGSFLKRIAQIIEDDKAVSKKQRHTSKRIYERLKAEGYSGGSTQVKEAVREIKRVNREVFMPLVHRPGEAQVDFGFAVAKVGGVLRKIAFFVMVLPYRGELPFAPGPNETKTASTANLTHTRRNTSSVLTKIPITDHL
jgi:transposase